MRFRDLAVGLFAVVYTSLLSFLALRGPFPALVPLGTPTAYRNLYIHVPQSIAALLLAAAAAAAAVLYLLKPTERRFIAMDRAAVLAAVFSWLSFFTGTAWAVESWGSAWSGDPRQMAVGVMAVLYTAYIILKRSVEDPDRLGRLAASYLIIAVASVPVTLAAPILFPALHPATGAALPQLAPAIRMWYSTALIILFALSALLMAGGRIPKPFAPAALAVAAAVGGYLLWENAQPLYRVFNATVSGDVIHIYTDRGMLTIPLDKAPVDPLVVNRTVALVGHLITERGEAVVHWSVGLNLIATGVAVMLISLLWGRRHE
jgi:heme exporter protein C